MKDILHNLNEDAKNYETHHNVNISINGIKVETTFNSYINVSLGIIEFNLIDEHSQIYMFEYSFLDGKLSCKSHIEDSVEVSDILSFRHLCSFLFFAREFVFMKNNSHNALTSYLHSSHPVPILYAERKNNIKHIFKVDNIQLCNNKEIVADGILAMRSNNDFWLPVYAKCRYTYKDKRFVWTYIDNGKETIVETNTNYYVATPHIEMPASIIYEYTRNKIISLINNPYSSPLEKGMLEILNYNKIPFISTKDNGIGVNNFIHVLIYGIKSISEKEIKFNICTESNPCSMLIYNRIRKQFFCNEKDWTERSFRRQYELMNHHEECNNKLKEAIDFIEQSI